MRLESETFENPIRVFPERFTVICNFNPHFTQSSEVTKAHETTASDWTNGEQHRL